MLLAQSFGLPVLGPQSGVTGPEEAASHVRLFDPRDDASLAAELRFALYDMVADPEGAAQARASARIAAERFTAADMALKFAEFIEPHLDRGA
jgi:hypothetical protein